MAHQLTGLRKINEICKFIELIIMIVNYLKTAFRNIWRNKFYSLLNILGLSVGFAIFLVIYFYIQFEFSFDKHFNRADQIYRVTTDMIWESGHIQRTAVSAPPTALFLKNDFPEVIEATRFIPQYEILAEKFSRDQSRPNLKYYEEIFYIDSSFFDVFSMDFLIGSPSTAFSIPQSIILTNDLAKKYFQDANPVGQLLRLNNDEVYTIMAVLKNPPRNSHFHFNFLVNDVSLPEFKPDAWRDMSAYTYVVLSDNTDHLAFEEKLIDFKIKYQEPYKDLIEFRVQPMLDVHMKSTKEFEQATTSSHTMLLSIAGIALVILIIASINYMNLSVARSLTRSREVGLRKVVGASKRMIITQFISESVIIVFIALFTGIVLSELILPIFNDFAETNISPDYLNEFPIIIGLGVLMGLVSGSYPAFFVSGYQPVKVLKSMTSDQKGGNGLKKVLVVFQFTVTIILLIATGVIYSQFSFIKNKDLGFNRDVMVNIYMWNDTSGRVATEFYNQLHSIPGVKDICLSDHVPGREPWFEHFWPEGFESHMPLRTVNVSPEYLPFFDLKLLEGRNFSDEFSTDTAACIINEAALEHFGWNAKDAIGKKIKNNFSRSWDEIIAAPVIGIVKDFHYSSLHKKIEPLVMTMHKKYYPIITVTLNGTSPSQVIGGIEEKYAELGYNYPFDFSFMDSDIREMYLLDKKIGQLIIVFSGLSIFIASLGLLGLSSFSLRRRMQEIGIRKVYGASVWDVLYIFTKEFSILILIASIVAIPTGWYFSKLWFENFAYHGKIGAWLYLLSALVALLIALATVTVQAYRYANQNPAEVLKYE